MEKANILVVDDETAILDLFKRMFKNTEHKLTAVDNGEDAIKILKENTFDIVFLDIIMKGMSGLIVLGEIKKLNPETNVVTMTGNIVDEYMMEIAEKGSDGFLSKPFDIRSVFSYVRRF